MSTEGNHAPLCPGSTKLANSISKPEAHRQDWKLCVEVPLKKWIHRDDNGKCKRLFLFFYPSTWTERKKCITVDLFSNWHMIMCRLRIQELKIRKLGGFEKIDVFSFFLLRKRLSSGQKCFLRPYFPLIRGMFVFRSGLRFSFRALEVPKPRVRKRSF